MVAMLAAAIASVVSGVFAVTLLTRFASRRHQGRRDDGAHALLFWGIALVMFAVAAVGLVSGVIGGWSSGEFRTFYLFGGVLNVPWLALGSVAVNARSPLVSRWTGGVLLAVAVVVGRQALVAEISALWLPATVLAGVWAIVLLVGVPDVVVGAAAAVLVVYTAVAVVTVLTAGYVEPLPVEGIPEGSSLFAPTVRGFAVGGNAVGAITVIVSALASSAVMVWRRPDRSADRLVIPDAREGGYVEALARWFLRGRNGQGPRLAHLVRGNLMIAAGVGIAAAGGVFSFLGETVGHALGFTLGVTVMYGGFVRTTRPLASPTSAGSGPVRPGTRS